MANNNETTTKFKVDISELKKAMQDAKRQISVTNSEFKAISSSMDDWSKSTDGISAKLRQLDSNLSSQKTILSSLEDQYRAVVAEQGEGSAAADRLKIAINNQKAVINQTEGEIKKYNDALEDVKDTSEEFEATNGVLAESFKGLATVGVAAFGAIATAIGAALGKALSFSDEAQKAINNFAAETGATADEMAKFEDVMTSIYNNNFGESMDDIAQAMAEVKKQAGDISSDELEALTTNALMLRDTFDFEVNESMRAAKMLMDQFGLSGEDAYNLIAQGAQGGLDKNGDLLDSINEYSVHFSQLGLNAEEMFNMLANGSAAGTFSVDKLGDAIKEFGIRVKDGSESSAAAFDYLGYDADALFEIFNKGGEDAAAMTQILIDELAGMPDSVEKTTAGVALFGTMWEDLGAEGIKALSELDGGISTTNDALEQINEVKYNSLGEALQGIGRNLQTQLLMPIGEKLLPVISELATKFSEWLNDPENQEAIQKLSEDISNLVDTGLAYVRDFVQWFLENKDAVVAGLAAIATGFLAFKVVTLIQGVSKAMQGMTIAQYALNLAMSLNPIGIIIALISALVAAFIYLWNNSESFREFWIELWDKIKEFCGKAIDAIVEFFTKTIPDALNKMITHLKQLPSKVWTWLVNTINKVSTWSSNMITKAKTAASNFVTNVINFIKELPTKLWTWLLNTINKVSQWGSNMTSKAKETASNFVNKVIEFVKQLPSKVWSWLSSTISKVADFGSNLASKGREAAQGLLENIVNIARGIPDQLKSIGSDIISGLWSGISGAVGGLYDNIKNSLSGLVDKAKKALGIHSPSKVFADEVGKWIPEGIAVGIDKNAKSALNSIRDLTYNGLSAARSGLSGTTSTAGVMGGTVNNFYQTNNSPKALSRLEIYRQSKNLLGYAGGV